ncbi:hypothetical protein TNCV_2415471 [Trichonephila clavipes]|nr:hypothetical protein TNCV_2415471 [Trichonephila clavipes]
MGHTQQDYRCSIFISEFCLAMKRTSGEYGYVNKQNCRIWVKLQSHKCMSETPLHPEKLTVWCALWAEVESLLQKNDEGHNVTVNGDRYRAMITN